MKDNKLLLTTSLILLIGLGLVGFKLYGQGRGEKYNPVFGDAKIDKFCINDFCLVKEDQKWKLDKDGGLPANNQVSDSFAQKLQTLTLGEVISTNKDRFKNLGIDETKLVVSVNGQKIWTGNINSSYDGTYVSYENGDKVYEANIIIDKNVLGQTSYWLQKEITNMDWEKINKVIASRGGKTLAINKKNDKWDKEDLVKKLAMLPSKKVIPNFNPEGSNIIEYQIETDQDKINLKVGQKKINYKEKINWANSDNKYYFEIDEIDYALLTAIKF